MKKLLMPFAAILMGVQVFAQGSRDEIILKEWEFRKDHEAKATEGWGKVNVPHDWAIYGPFDKANDLQTVAVEQNGETVPTEKTGRTGGLPYIGKGTYRRALEIGAGQHGEGGGVRVPMASAKETIGLIAEPLCAKLGLQAGDKAFVMVNGCGATTMMEMLVLFKDTVEFLNAKGVEVVGNMVGEILTVQEAAGFQLNIAKWDEETIRLWNTPCHTPAYSKV